MAFAALGFWAHSTALPWLLVLATGIVAARRHPVYMFAYIGGLVLCGAIGLAVVIYAVDHANFTF